MNQLVVIAFDRLEDAREAMRRLRSLEREGMLKFEDTAIVERMSDGTTHVRNEVSGAVETGAVIGAALGGMVTFFFPVAGMAVGAAIGAAIGRAMDTGVSGEFVEEVKRTLSPGRSALFLVLREGHADAALAALRQFKGEVIQTTLPTEVEDALRDTLGDRKHTGG